MGYLPPKKKIHSLYKMQIDVLTACLPQKSENSFPMYKVLNIIDIKLLLTAYLPLKENVSLYKVQINV